MGDTKVLENFINGEFVPCEDLIDSYNPATGEVIFQLPNSSRNVVDLAVESAGKAFKR